jgi:outer membrane protein assembly factor BamE (lipoprotein component of BamABCDE complex)
MNKLSQARASFSIRATPFAALCLAALVAGGCASPSYTITPEMQARAAAENPAPPKDDDFPAADSAKWRQGAFPSLGALRAMHTGMGKDQVRGLLGFPHFSEGLGGVREWNYIFHFRTGAGPAYITCQYMVRFNADVLTNGMYWKGPGCADLLRPPPAAARPVAAVQPAPAPARTTLGADGLFRFDGRSLADLLPEGRRRLDALASDIKANARPGAGGAGDRPHRPARQRGLQPGALAGAGRDRARLPGAGRRAGAKRAGAGQGRIGAEGAVRAGRSRGIDRLPGAEPPCRDRGVRRAMTPAAMGRVRTDGPAHRPVCLFRYAPPLRASATTSAGCATWSL